MFCYKVIRIASNSTIKKCLLNIIKFRKKKDSIILIHLFLGGSFKVNLSIYTQEKLLFNKD